MNIDLQRPLMLFKTNYCLLYVFGVSVIYSWFLRTVVIKKKMFDLEPKSWNLVVLLGRLILSRFINRETYSEAVLNRERTKCLLYFPGRYSFALGSLAFPHVVLWQVTSGLWCILETYDDHWGILLLHTDLFACGSEPGVWDIIPKKKNLSFALEEMSESHCQEIRSWHISSGVKRSLLTVTFTWVPWYRSRPS